MEIACFSKACRTVPGHERIGMKYVLVNRDENNGRLRDYEKPVCRGHV